MARQSHHAGQTSRPLLGLRGRPGRLALHVFKLPVHAYERGWGWVMGRTFLRLVHVGRRTGRPHSTVAMVLVDDRARREAVICSAWGPGVDWVRNLRARPGARVDIGRDSFTPAHRFLTEDEAVAVGEQFRERHPLRLRFMSWVLGWGDLRSEEALRAFVASRPFVALTPTDASGEEWRAHSPERASEKGRTMRRTPWSQLTQAQRRLITAGAVAQIALQVAALRDLRHRRPDEIRGHRWLWGCVTFVNVIGPCAYFVFGRRRTH